MPWFSRRLCFVPEPGEFVSPSLAFVCVMRQCRHACFLLALSWCVCLVRVCRVFFSQVCAFFSVSCVCVYRVFFFQGLPRKLPGGHLKLHAGGDALAASLLGKGNSYRESWYPELTLIQFFFLSFLESVTSESGSEGFSSAC